jgi:hypothetical protein
LLLLGTAFHGQRPRMAALAFGGWCLILTRFHLERKNM